MPLYDYNCPVHGRFDMLSSIDSRHDGKCEQCKLIPSAEVALREANPFTWYQRQPDGTRKEIGHRRDHI